MCIENRKVIYTRGRQQCEHRSGNYYQRGKDTTHTHKHPYFTTYRSHYYDIYIWVYICHTLLSSCLYIMHSVYHIIFMCMLCFDIVYTKELIKYIHILTIVRTLCYMSQKEDFLFICTWRRDAFMLNDDLLYCFLAGKSNYVQSIVYSVVVGNGLKQLMVTIQNTPMNRNRRISGKSAHPKKTRPTHWLN